MITDNPDLTIEQIRIMPEPGKLEIGGVVQCADCMTIMAFAHDDAAAPMSFLFGEGWVMIDELWHCQDCGLRRFPPGSHVQLPIQLCQTEDIIFGFAEADPTEEPNENA